MGFFSFRNKDKIENENKSKPFHENINNSERKEWFSRTRPWHKVAPRIIDTLIAKYNEDPMFEVFVFASMENSLVNEYVDIGLKCTDPDVACSIISGVLAKHGSNSSSQVNNMFKSGNINQKKLSKIYQNAMNLLESSIVIDANQIIAYIQLANLKGIINKNDEALDFVNQGLKAIKKIKDIDAPFHKSSLPEIKNAAQHIDETENILLALKKEFT
jgi:hypothetical protein